MASFNDTGLRFFAFSGNTAISAFARVTTDTNGNVQCAGPTAADVGILDLDVGPANGQGNLPAAVRMPTCPGSRKVIADYAVTAWGYVYKSYTGFVTVSGSTAWAALSASAVTLGIAAAPAGQTVAATAFGSVFELLPIQGVV